jgi:hypothetical protein
MIAEEENAAAGLKRSFVDAGIEDSENVLNPDLSNVQAMPLKRFFRSRAHCNPLSHNDGFHYPLSAATAGIGLG